MRRFAAVVSIVFVAGAGLVAAARASTQTDAAEVKLLEKINAGRASRVGKSAEVMHAGLRAKARAHSQSQASKHALTHDGFSSRISGATPDPYEANGPPDDGFNGSACENVAYFGPASSWTTDQVAQKFYDLWYNSSGHRDCMFDAYGYNLNVAGVGVYLDSSGYWWATFDSARDSTPPTATSTPPPSTSTPPPPTGTWTRAQENDAAVTYSGSGWGVVSSSSASGGTFKRSPSAGAKATFAFDGTGVKWIGLKKPSGGYVEVRLDGVLKATVDCYASSSVWKTTLYQVTGLVSGSHTLELTVKGTKRSASSGTNGYVDAFDRFS